MMRSDKLGEKSRFAINDKYAFKRLNLFIILKILFVSIMCIKTLKVKSNNILMYSFAIKNGGEKFLESIRQLRDIKKREKEGE